PDESESPWRPLSRPTRWAIAILVHLAQHATHVQTRDRLAVAIGAPRPMAAKLLIQLSHAGVVAAHRGPLGGDQPARPAATINMVQVVEIIQGPPIVGLAFRSEGAAALDRKLERIVATIATSHRELLRGTTLADLAAGEA